MQARRFSNSSIPLPSSPPFVLSQQSELGSPLEGRGAPSPAQTLWTAHPSPTQTLGHSSPELPPLPTFAVLGGTPRTPSTVARHPPTDNTAYYTASWGSPYRDPPPVFNPRREGAVSLGSDDLEEDSSNLLFGLEHLLPPRLTEEQPVSEFSLEHLLQPRLTEDERPTEFSLEHLLPSRLRRDQLQTPTKASSSTEATAQSFGLDVPGHSSQQFSNPSTAKWVQQFLEGHWNSWDNEAGNWWSDSADSDREDKSENERPATLGVTHQKKKKKKGHKSRKNNLTLKQQDFWSHFSQGQKEAFTKMMSSRYAVPSRRTSGASEKTLLSPAPVPAEESPLATPKEERKQELPTPVVEKQPSLAFSSAPRQRKRVPWKGKACWVAIPKDIPRGTPGYPPKPMSTTDVERKMQEFEKAGYDTRGFDHWKGDVDQDRRVAQNRAIWPDEAAIREERAGKYRVYVPNKSEWDAYMNHLTELKLAALGVSLGGGEEEEETQMSRQTSSQLPESPFLPPLPTSSAGSHRFRQGSIAGLSVSPFPLGPSPGHASRQSIASPMSAFGNSRAAMHMHRHSTFTSPASFLQQQSASPLASGAWSPGGYFGAQSARGGSPAVRPDLADLASPNSPFGLGPTQRFPATPGQKDDLFAQIQQQQQLQAQLIQQQQQQLLGGIRPSSTLAEVPEDEAEEDEIAEMRHAAKPAPEIAVPTPHGHRHNISANLEREARNAEYHLEEAIDKQFNEGGDFSTEPEMTSAIKHSNPVTNSNWEEPQQILHQPQPHNRDHSLTKPQRAFSFGYSSQQPEGQQAELSDGARTNVSDITNPSMENAAHNSVHHSKTASQLSSSWKFGQPASTMHSKHASKSSISKLNVEAKEFKFNPSASFSPGAFSNGFSFTPTTSNPVGQDTTGWNNKPSMDSIASGYNASVPVFKPTAPVFTPAVAATAPIFKPGAMNMPSSNFDFASSQGSSFKPDVPAFSPPAAFSPSLPVSPPTTISSKIFSNVSISASDIIKPAKRSKAVPIIKPDATQQKTPEKQDGQEDEFGRVTQVDGREKRARHARDDGDEVPKFAAAPVVPSQPLGESTNFQATKQDPQVSRETVLEDKENLSPNTERVTSKSKSPEPLSAAALQQEHAFIAPGMPTPKTDMEISDSRTPIEDRTPHESDAETISAEESRPAFKSKHRNTSSLSATAKPFEFRPQTGSSSFDVGIHVTKPSVARSEDFDDNHERPARHMSRSPATTFRPSDDGSYRTALETRRHVPYAESESVDFDRYAQPSFNEIDAIMQHMNQEGSDFGVEKDEHPWDQSSPRRSVHDFERSDLPPNTNMRSDAPSPSPRRLYAAQNLGASSTSIAHDPFSDGRAGMAYDSPVHRLNNPDDVPVSDWDQDIVSEGEDKIRTRSRFFDNHVDELLSRLLQSRLGPLERNLQDIHESIALMSQHSGRGRRSMSTNERDSDADDEDEEIGTDSHYRNRSPRKDRKLEKIRSIIKEALDSYQPSVTSLPVPVSEPLLPEKIREIVVDALSAHQPQAPRAPSEPVPAEQIRAIIKKAIASQATPAPVSQPIHPDEIRSIVTEALASHLPQVPSVPVVEPIQPDTIRSIIVEALESQKPTTEPKSEQDMSEFYQIVGSLKATVAQAVSGHVQPEDIREMIEEALARQNTEIAHQRESQLLQEKENRITELESLLKETTLRIDEEAKARQALEAREENSTRLLKVTEEELALLKEAARDDETRIRALEDQREQVQSQVDAYQSGEEELLRKVASLTVANDELKLRALESENAELDAKKKLDAAAAENEALQFTLKEYRISSDKWRAEIQRANEDKERMRKAIDHSRVQAEEATRVRETMRAKLENLQQDMIVAAGQAAAERAQWQKSDEAHMKKYEVLSARIEAEGRTRERLERELERLETQEREGMKLRVTLEQTQKANVRLEEIIRETRKESIEHQKNAEKFEREFKEAREAGRVEVRRTRILMEADIDAANNQVNIIRADLESEIARLRTEIDNVRMEADTTKAKHELDLEAASDAKKQALDEAMEGRQRALQEQQHSFEHRLELLLKEHERALDLAREDKERAESYHKDRLSLADSKAEHLNDKIALLEEKLAVAKEAASAAVQAAQAKGPAENTSSYGLSTTEKISPQALRESIAVLQEQLQERESRIESLEQKLAEADTDAPAKLKERDTEITWLRELLGVRIDDLSDLINALSQPVFEREAVRDAAIRIRTNLQMEQQEKERLMAGGQSFPTLATLSNFASPKAVQLAAAFGNWRKGRENASSALGAGSHGPSRNHTPSRVSKPSGTAQSFLSGLMTPPTSNMRRTPDLAGSNNKTRPQISRSSSASSKISQTSMSVAGFPSLGKQPQAVPSTPPLMRKANYDQDAEDGPFNESGFYDDESTVDGDVTPIGLSFGQELVNARRGGEE
ncbi:hypothetical protein GQ43DRAFT_375053 [Delitschia confertaspora ATCC 74209]|uniref:Uncharacterized protein n=1 Tax=Delitschia confertaspora ATCC 74209 TaxID=1513339 RepID=A0A9P4JKJ3_9PLEO|nr:hypothetical protein GQ43DRAFT_375053 [Delitschia confertaspora ATCC 74209]